MAESEVGKSEERAYRRSVSPDSSVGVEGGAEERFWTGAATWAVGVGAG